MTDKPKNPNYKHQISFAGTIATESEKYEVGFEYRVWLGRMWKTHINKAIDNLKSPEYDSNCLKWGKPHYMCLGCGEALLPVKGNRRYADTYAHTVKSSCDGKMSPIITKLTDETSDIYDDLDDDEDLYVENEDKNGFITLTLAEEENYLKGLSGQETVDEFIFKSTNPERMSYKYELVLSLQAGDITIEEYKRLKLKAREMKNEPIQTYKEPVEGNYKCRPITCLFDRELSSKELYRWKNNIPQHTFYKRDGNKWAKPHQVLTPQPNGEVIF